MDHIKDFLKGSMGNTLKKQHNLILIKNEVLKILGFGIKNEDIILKNGVVTIKIVQGPKKSEAFLKKGELKESILNKIDGTYTVLEIK